MSDERAAVLAAANEPRFADMPPAGIVPMPADEGIYLTSDSTFSRILRAHGQVRHRGRAKARRQQRPPTTHIAWPRYGVVGAIARTSLPDFVKK